MKQILQQVALIKKADAVIQAIIFIVLTGIYLVNGGDITAYMLIMATLQVISCTAWALFFRSDTPRYLAGTRIRHTFLVVLLIALISFLFPPLFFLFMLIMLLLGPVLGLTYFAITILESRFYSKARKPYYLL